MRKLRATILVLALSLPATAIAADAGVDTLATQPVAAAEAPDAGITVERLAEDVKAVIGAIKALGGKEGESKAEMSLLYALLVAAILKTILDALRKWGPRIISNGTVLKVTCLGAGVVIFFLEHYGAGAGFGHSFMIALGGPGAILLTEILKLFGLRHEKDGEKADG